MERRLKQTTSRSDNDINDEEAGRARIEMARQSALRRQESQQALRRSNSELKQRLNQVKAKTDVDITDDESQQYREGFAANSKKRREQEAARLKAENAALKARVAAVHARTDDGDGLSTLAYGSPRPGSPLLDPIDRPSDIQHTT